MCVSVCVCACACVCVCVRVCVRLCIFSVGIANIIIHNDVIKAECMSVMLCSMWMPKQ